MKKKIPFPFSFITAIAIIIFANPSFCYAQVFLNANGPGNTYEDINAVLAPGYNVIEAPDLAPDGSHQGFGRHIAEVWDTDLGKYVFEFYSHALLDNDIATLELDRQRVEIKTYGNSPANLIGTLGETIRYQWRFKVPTGFQPSSNFTHIHQIKAVDGDDSKPLFALTPRKGTPNQLEFNYAKDSLSVTYATADLSLFEGTWVEATEVIKVGATGTYSIVLKRVSDGTTLLSYSNANIATIRPSNSFIRPKWGIYRSILDIASLRDEAVRFSDFSITEGVSFAETGDYRSVVTGSGNWSALASWQVRDAGGNWAAATALPAATNNVFIQSGDSVIVDVTAACKDLYINQDITVPGKLGIGVNIVQVSGKVRAYTGTEVSGTTDNVFYSSQDGTTTGFSNTAAITTTGAVRIVGASRQVFISGAWGPVGFTKCALEFNMDNGATATIDASIKFKSISIGNGTTVNATANAGIGADDGSLPSLGTVTIKTGGKLISARSGAANQVIAALANSKCGTVTIETGAIIELTDVDPAIDATTIVNNGTVVYSKTGSQNLLKKGMDATSIDPNNYYDIRLQNSGTKQLPAVNISVANALYMEGTASFSNSTFTASKAVMANGSTIYRNGTGSINSTLLGFGSLPTDLINVTVNTSNTFSGELVFSPVPGGIGTLTIANGVSYTIQSSRSITDLNLNNSGLLILSPSSTLTLTINGNIAAGNGTITGNTNASISFAGANNGSGGTLKFTTGSQVANGLTINRTGTAAIITVGSPVSLSGNLALTAGTLADGGNVLSLSGSITGTGTHTGAGKISMNTNGTTISGALLGNLEIAPGAGNAIALSGSGTIAGTLTLTNGTLSVSSYTLTLNGPAINTVSGVLNTVTASSLVFGGTNAGPLNIPSSVFLLNNLTLNNTNAVPAALNANSSISIAANLALTSGILAGGANIFTVAGNVTGTATHTGTGKITLIGSGKTISGVTVSNLEIASGSTVTATAAVGIGNNLTLTTGTFADGGFTIVVPGNIAGAGAHSGAGKIKMTGSGKSIAGVALGNLEIASAGTISAIADFTINNDLTLASGTLADGGNTITLAGSIAGTATHSGTGKIRMTGGSKSIAAVTLANLELFGTGSVSGVAAAITGTLNLNSSGNFSIVSPNTLTMANNSSIVRNGSGNFNLGSGSLVYGSGVNVTINITCSNGAEVIPTSGTINMLTIANGINYTITGGRTIVDFANNGTITFNTVSGLTFTINGNISGAGNIYSTSTCTLVLNGTTGNQLLNFVAGGRILKDLTLNSNVTATIGTALDITAGSSPGTVTVASGATLNAAGNLVLKSDINGTARVANSAGTISGDVMVERYIPANANRGWRLLSVPTISTQTIKTSWQATTWITSKLPTAIADGFDAQSNGNSLLSYNSSTNTWNGVTTNTNTTGIATNGGYMLFVRGDRTATNLSSPVTPTALSTKGPLKQGMYPAAAITVNAGKYELIGNPYASAIDLRTITRTGGADAVFYVWDPKLLGTYKIGAMQTLTFNGSNYKITPGGGSFGVSGSTMNTLQSGQAFLAHATGSNGTVQFTEAAKVSGSANVFRPTAPTEEQLVTNLYAMNGSTRELADGTLNMYNNDFTNAVNGSDAKKFTNFGENFGISREGQLLAVELREQIGTTDTIYYNTTKLKQRAYQIELIAANLDHTNLLGKMIDCYLNDSIAINLNGTNSYHFTITADTASSSPSRFKVVFYQSGELPVNQLNLTASQDNRVVSLNWKVDNQININAYEVEWVNDGIHFSKVQTKAAIGRNGENGLYDWKDQLATMGDNYYRVKMIAKAGNSTYSNIVKQYITALTPAIHIYPNITTGRSINLKFTDMEKGVYSLRLINAVGQVLKTYTQQHNGGSFLYTKALPANSSQGNYRLEIIQPGNRKTVLALMLVD